MQYLNLFDKHIKTVIMRKINLIIALIIFLLIPSSLFPQDHNLEFNVLAGATAVDIEEAIGEEIEDWSVFNLGILATAAKSVNENMDAGLELGFQQLYYYEYIYDYPAQVGYSSRWEYGNASTIHLGAVFNFHSTGAYFKTGGNIRVFTDGSGVTLGLLTGGGFKINVSDKVYIPLGLRLDVVFGNATPIGLTLDTGVNIAL